MQANLQKMREDKILRDAAMAVVQADISHIKTDYQARNLVARFATRMSEGATDVFEEAVDVAQDNKGVLATLIAAVMLWFARNPILSLLDDSLEIDDPLDTQ